MIRTFNFVVAGRLEKPLPPVLVNATHHSIELQWENIRVQDQHRPEQRRLYDESGAPRAGTLIYLHQREKRSGSFWESAYTYVKDCYFHSFSFFPNKY